MKGDKYYGFFFDGLYENIWICFAKKSSNFVYISAYQCGLQFDDFLRIFQADLKKKKSKET